MLDSFLMFNNRHSNLNDGFSLLFDIRHSKFERRIQFDIRYSTFKFESWIQFDIRHLNLNVGVSLIFDIRHSNLNIEYQTSNQFSITQCIGIFANSSINDMTENWPMYHICKQHHDWHKLLNNGQCIRHICKQKHGFLK